MDADPLPLETAISKRFAAWLARSEGLLDDDLRQRIAAYADPSVFAGARRHRCHRDFRPENWRWDTDRQDTDRQDTDRQPGRLWILDLGHAKADHWLTDLVKLETAAWRQRPHLRAAFFDGFGRPLSDLERRQLGQLISLHGLQTATWALIHNDATLAQQGVDILRRQLPEV